ncbi:MAG: glycosyltransferase family 4 protein [Bacteroidales bacterium]
MYRIAYLTSKDPLDKKSSSGVYYYQSSALKKYCTEIVYLGPVNNLLIRWLKKVFNFLQKFTRKKYNHGHSLIISRIYGRIFSRKLKEGKFDFIFADKSSCEIAFLKTNIPLIYSTDATFVNLHDYYPGYTNLFRFSSKESNSIEQNAINNSSIVICASKWAADSVTEQYRFPARNVHVLPRGANIDFVPDIQQILKKKKNNICQLLFIGKEYKRKGFQLAFKTMQYIRSVGLPVKLIAVGFTPPPEYIDKDLEIIDYIDKNTTEGMERFHSLMLNSDFYLQPTRAECMGIAFCEAASFGLPVITTDTGGVTEVVKDGVNGFALPYQSDHTEYGDKIISIFKSDKDYYNLIKSSRDYYEKRLNWEVWGEGVKKILDNYNTNQKPEVFQVSEEAEYYIDKSVIRKVI